ncbi:MAG TPA: hypothetical protein VGO22_14300 [Pseudorhizobium sp.]|nr:hypothetical protein [Pseudorhizobium sp.]
MFKQRFILLYAHKGFAFAFTSRNIASLTLALKREPARRHLMEAAKTLAEMTVIERRELIDFVASALEGTSEEARVHGDQQSALNSYNLALAIRGSAAELATGDLRSAELLLQQGISLVAASLSRSQGPQLH